MDKVDYMASLEMVAEDFGEIADYSTHLPIAWKMFEACAAQYGYDLFVDESDIRQELKVLTHKLYLVPGADWKADVQQIKVKDRDYGGSWCKRGGTNAFFMLVRKWDRVEKAIEDHGSIRAAVIADSRPEGILDDLGDLRRYLLLVQAYRHAKENPPPKIGINWEAVEPPTERF